MRSTAKLIFANLFGTLLEVYDMSIYAFFAPVIAKNFFPSSNEHMALIKTMLIFVVGFVVRPIGSIILGHIGDIYGRRITLIITISLISLATFGIGILPNANQIGLFAPLLLILFRIMQGISFSSEYIGSLIFLYENASPLKKNFIASWATFGGNLGLLVSSALCWIITYFCTTQQLENWGWRIPFLLAVSGSLLSLVLRYQISETYQMPLSSKAPPLAYVLENQKKNLIKILSGAAFYMIISYVLFVWSIIYFNHVLTISMKAALSINTVAICLQVVLIPFFGSLADKYGKLFFLKVGVISLIVLIMPYYLLLETKNVGIIFIAHIIITICATSFTSLLPIYLIELMPAQARFTGVSLGYNIAGMCVGGSMPLIGMFFIETHETILLLSSYFVFWAALAFYSLPTGLKNKTFVKQL